MKKKRLCVIVSASMNLYSLYKKQFEFLKNNGYSITAVAAKGIEHQWLKEEGINTKVIPFRRKPAPIVDFFTFIQLSWFLAFNKFDIVSISTPKASFIGALSSLITFQKNIIYTIRGRAYENTQGLKRKLYEFIEFFICRVSHEVFSISHEIKNDLISKKLCSKDKIFVIGSGSSNGVDLKVFSLNKNNLRIRQVIRNSLGVGDKDILILYSGRLRKDKGINELIFAFKNISSSFFHVHLLLQGEFEYFDPLNKEVIREIYNNPKIHLKGWTKNVEHFFAAADIFAFPSHREGFGNVAIEASAMELPIVGFNVIGCRESIKDGVTGILCENINFKDLEDGLVLLLENPSLRKKLGTNGRKRVVEEFDSKIIWKGLLNKYDELIYNMK